MRNVAKKGLLTAVATGSVLASTAGYAYASAEAHGGAVNSPGVGSGNSVQVPVDIPVNACGNTVDVIGLLNPAYGNRCANADAGTHGHAATGGQHAAGDSEAGRSATGGGAPAHSAPAQTVPAQSAPAHQAGQRPGGGGWDASGISGSGASASGTTAGSPGVLSGNSAAVPVHIPVNACGNSANVVGAGNPAFGNSCANVSVPAPPATTEEECPPEETGPTTPPETPGTPRAGGPADAPAVTQAVAKTPAVVPAQSTGPQQLASTGAGGVEMLGAAGLAALLGGGVLYRRARAGAR